MGRALKGADAAMLAALCALVGGARATALGVDALAAAALSAGDALCVVALTHAAGLVLVSDVDLLAGWSPSHRGPGP